MNQPDQTTVNFAELTADIVSAYVAKNSVQGADLPTVIAEVYAALQGLSAPSPQKTEKQQPAVSVRKSVTPDFLISMEDGRSYKTLKRHLAGLGLTPDQYRAKWDLPRDYPMVAPNYAQRRSELAKTIGLGRLQRNSTEAKAAAKDETVAAPAEASKPRRAPAKKSKARE